MGRETGNGERRIEKVNGTGWRDDGYHKRKERNKDRTSKTWQDTHGRESKNTTGSYKLETMTWVRSSKINKDLKTDSGAHDHQKRWHCASLTSPCAGVTLTVCPIVCCCCGVELVQLYPGVVFCAFKHKYFACLCCKCVRAFAFLCCLLNWWTAAFAV